MGTAALTGGVAASRWLDGVLTRIGTALDRAALAGMRLAFADALHPTQRACAALGTCADPYLDPALQREPRRFFAFLDAPAGPPEARTLESRTVPGGEIVVRELESAYAPWHASDAWLRCAENARVPFQHWLHRDRPARGVVIAIHGFTMGRPWIDGRVLMAAQWFALGLDVVMPILPFHGIRAPRWARYSGEAFGSWNVGRLNEAVRQSVYDVDLVRRWLRARGGPPVGVMGLSLGGYVAALLAGLCPDLAFAVPVAAPSSLAWLPQRLFGFGRVTPPGPPIPPAVLDAAYRVHSPLTYPLAMPRRRAFLVGGLGDGVVPPAQVHALWRHWGEPALHWFSGGHTTPFGRTQIMARIEAHLAPLL
jgi:Serine hydrolase (FSH1)